MTSDMNMAVKCDSCSHTFGEHFETYNSHKTGCAWSYESQRDSKSTCGCKGFSVIFKYRRDSGMVSGNAGSLGAMAEADPIHGPYGSADMKER